MGEDGAAHAREDQPSVNGTFVGGDRVGTVWHALPDGAQLRLGRSLAATVRYVSPA